MKRVGRLAGSGASEHGPRGPRLAWAILVAIAAVPVLAGVYMLSLRSRAHALRILVLGIVVLSMGTLMVVALTPQAEGRHPPPIDTRAIARLATPLVADVAGNQPISLSFNVPMDRKSVGAALAITPLVPVRLQWARADTLLAVVPLHAWAPGTLYTISVGSGARSAAGAPLGDPVRALFFTADAPTATIRAAALVGSRASPAAGFQFTFSRAIDVSSLQAALEITPSATGQLSAGLQRDAPMVVTWVPSQPLAPDTTYSVTFGAPVFATDGMAVSPVPRYVVRTLDQPTVVRTRPADHAQGVAAGSSVSVRFDRAMDRSTTQAAFRLVALPNGARVAGTFSWAEHDTVLVFVPAHALAAGHAYTLSVAATATDRNGIPIALPAGAKSLRASFRVAASTVAGAISAATPATAVTPATPAPVRSPAPTPQPPAAAAPSASAPWLSVEQYALQLLNCTRTGGWVRSDGTCDGYGSGRYSSYVVPLTLSAGISANVSRPYAKYQAVRDACSHFLDGTPGDRLARAGYTSYRWAENIGCQSGNPRQVAINSLIFFQSEKSYAGGHWVNLKNPAYSTVGIGVWDANGYVLVVFDFYHP
jgi:uncharacterized protein YkwD